MTDSASVRALVADLGVLPGAIRAGLRQEFRQAGKVALDRARQNASWSSRIPAAISLRVSTSATGAGIALRVDSSRAPHARPYEGFGASRGGTFRHPVFGGPAWATQGVRPFLLPAVRQVAPEVVAAAEAAVARAARTARFT